MDEEKVKEEGEEKEPEIRDVNATLLWLKTRTDKIVRRLDALENALNETQELRVREAMADIPETFEVKGQKLSMHHPTFFKLELIGEIVDEIAQEVRNDKELSDMPLNTTGDLIAFLLRLMAKYKSVREKVYEILQIMFDPEPDPDRANLSVDKHLVKCLDMVKVVEAFVRKSVPFYQGFRNLMTFGRRSVGPGRIGAGLL